MRSKTSYWDQIEAAFEAVDIYEGPEIFRKDAAEFPDWKIQLLAIHWTMSEVANGGLEQFFGNSTGVLAPEAADGLERIGCPDLAKALRTAMTLLGEEYPRESNLRRERLTLLNGREFGDAQAFSAIPKWVTAKMGVASQNEDPGPFAEFDELFFKAGDDIESAMDSYAHAKASL